MSISTATLLVELNISVWTANKLDKTATKSVTTDNLAATDAAKVHKNLMAGTSIRKDIADFAALCRTFHAANTLPWSDKGTRILPMGLFFKYKEAMDKYKDQFDTMVSKFLLEYPNHIERSKASLGSLFQESDYPPVEELREKFAYKLVFSPVPESGDFRVDVPQADLQEIMRDYETNFNTRLQNAMRTPWEQLHKLITNMSEKLAEGDADEKKRWHDTFLTNAHGLCGMLSHLNITNDPELERARLELERAIYGVQIEDVKEDPLIRADMKSKLDALLNAYSW